MRLESRFFGNISFLPGMFLCCGTVGGIFQFEADAQTVVCVIRTDYSEPSDFSGMGHMLSDAGADVIVADPDYSQDLPGLFGKFAQVDLVGKLLAADQFGRNRKVFGDDFIDFLFYCGNLLVRRRTGELIVAFGFLFFNMGVFGPPATEHADHRLVQDVFGRVHGRVFLFVVAV